MLREAFGRHGGVEVDTQGDAFFVAFSSASSALAAAADAQDSLTSIPVRMGIHTGEPALTGESYVGMDVHRAARICCRRRTAGRSSSRKPTVPSASTVELRDLGEHRLKDLAEPVAPVPARRRAIPAAPDALRARTCPRPRHAVRRRSAEVAEVRRLIHETASRLLTLTGPGGTGKTRLALAGRRRAPCRTFPDGVFLVPLAPLRDPAPRARGGRQALGAKDGLAEHIGEQRVAAAARQLRAGRRRRRPSSPRCSSAAPTSRLLVTSRELLRIAGERRVPGACRLRETEARPAVLRRARRGSSPTRPSTRSVRRLDNLPLALELAAARTQRALAASDPRAALRRGSTCSRAGATPRRRQQTLRATIEWSHDLLTEDRAALFARLAVFARRLHARAPPRASRRPTSTRSSRSSTRASSAIRRSASGCSRRSASSRSSGSSRRDAAAALRRRHFEYFRDLAEEAVAATGRGRSEPSGLIGRGRARQRPRCARLGTRVAASRRSRSSSLPRSAASGGSVSPSEGLALARAGAVSRWRSSPRPRRRAGRRGRICLVPRRRRACSTTVRGGTCDLA